MNSEISSYFFTSSIFWYNIVLIGYALCEILMGLGFILFVIMFFLRNKGVLGKKYLSIARNLIVYLNVYFGLFLIIKSPYVYCYLYFVLKSAWNTSFFSALLYLPILVTTLFLILLYFATGIQPFIKIKFTNLYWKFLNVYPIIYVFTLCCIFLDINNFDTKVNFKTMYYFSNSALNWENDVSKIVFLFYTTKLTLIIYFSIIFGNLFEELIDNTEGKIVFKRYSYIFIYLFLFPIYFFLDNYFNVNLG